MLTETDERYLTQGSMQMLLCLKGSECFCEKLMNSISYGPAMPAHKHLARARTEMKKAYEIFVDGIVPEQYKRLERFSLSHRIALVSEADPVLQKVPMIMDWSHARVLVDVINKDVCTLCDKDRSGVKNCELRKAILDIGGEPDMTKAKINEWCEISRGIL